MWGFKQSNTDFICAIGRCVKFIDPINVPQIGVHKQTVRFVNEYLFIHIHVKNYILTIKHFISTHEFLFSSFIQ